MMLRLLLAAAAVVGQVLGQAGSEEPWFVQAFSHAGLDGTQHGRGEKDMGDNHFLKTNSDVPLLPRLDGVMGTHGTYRWLDIIEQTMTMIGEPKHGIWRIQDNGCIREYRKKDMPGLPEGTDANQRRLPREHMSIVQDNYGAYLPEESWSGYKYPDDSMAADGTMNWVDLSIHHAKYMGKYDEHVPIDLPHFYCTMSGPEYPHVHDVWKFAIKQPEANKIGPLGIRAGLDIKENYHNVIQFNMFGDAGIWANIGIGDVATDHLYRRIQFKYNSNSMRTGQTVNYQRLDPERMNIEVYLFERPFFNTPYLFITVVVENKEGPSFFSYLRPDGPYWDGLQERGLTGGVNTVPDHYPRVFLEKNRDDKRFIGLPLYGHHHPDRAKYMMNGGACPMRGGDWGRYPWGNGGAGWPTNLQEITPACDGLVMDVKAWMNLWNESWNDDNLLMGNAAVNAPESKMVVNYAMDANIYGQYDDPYLVEKGARNPYLMDLTSDGVMQMSAEGAESVTLKMNMTRESYTLGYTPVEGLGKNVPNYRCPAKPEAQSGGNAAEEIAEDVSKLVEQQIKQWMEMSGSWGAVGAAPPAALLSCWLLATAAAAALLA